MGVRWVAGVMQWDLTWTRARYLVRFEPVPRCPDAFWAMIRGRIEAAGFGIVRQSARYVRVRGYRPAVEAAVRRAAGAS